MAKKIEEAEVKKECPSCGLGVALDSRICEFCGWDFEEEDEWILQIEKLERDLMLEKQKFAPGTVNAKIESTIHTPVLEMASTLKTQESQQRPPSAPPVVKISEPRFSPSPVREPLMREEKAAPPAPEKVRRVRSVKKTTDTDEEAPSSPQPPKVRRVRSVRQKKSSDGSDDLDLDFEMEPEGAKLKTSRKGGK